VEGGARLTVAGAAMTTRSECTAIPFDFGGDRIGRQGLCASPGGSPLLCVEARLEMAAWVIVAAWFTDGLDGAIAR
jgi:phosphatidylglycerophosphate synthase